MHPIPNFNQSNGKRSLSSGLTRGKLIVSVSMLVLIVGLASNGLRADTFFAPDQPGPYKVGFTTFSGTVGAGLPTTITVWYPHCLASDLGCSSNPLNSSGTYVATIFSGPNPQFSQPSPLGAVENGSVQQGSFPFIVWAHPGGAFPIDRALFRLVNYPLLEVLASHGFIVASYERNGGAPFQCANELAGPRDVITRMETRSSTSGDMFEGRIDSNKIGAMAHSGGGVPVYPLVSGADPSATIPAGLAPDPRVKAMFVAEATNNSVNCGITLARRQSVTTPVLVMGGSQENFVLLASNPFNEMVNASSRILVKTVSKPNNPTLALNAGHFSYSSGLCIAIDRAREESLELQRQYFVANGFSTPFPYVDPLTGTVSSIADSAARVIGGEARFFWDGPITTAKAKVLCNRVGTDASSILPLDVSPLDGFTDVPPFVDTPIIFSSTVSACPGAPVVPCITGEKANRLSSIFAVSFWKRFLAGDTRYARYLTNEYSNNEPDVITTTVGSIYAFRGFFSPVDNYPTSNSVKAGQSVPVRFNLGGDQGLSIFAAGYPRSEWTGCGTAPADPIEETVTAGQSGLQYDSTSDEYTYVWKTDKAWKGTCRQLVVKLNDNQTFVANFSFN